MENRFKTSLPAGAGPSIDKDEANPYQMVRLKSSKWDHRSNERIIENENSDDSDADKMEEGTIEVENNEETRQALGRHRRDASKSLQGSILIVGESHTLLEDGVTENMLNAGKPCQTETDGEDKSGINSIPNAGYFKTEKKNKQSLLGNDNPDFPNFISDDSDDDYKPRGQEYGLNLENKSQEYNNGMRMDTNIKFDKEKTKWADQRRVTNGTSRQERINSTSHYTDFDSCGTAKPILEKLPATARMDDRIRMFAVPNRTSGQNYYPTDHGGECAYSQFVSNSRKDSTQTNRSPLKTPRDPRCTNISKNRRNHHHMHKWTRNSSFNR